MNRRYNKIIDGNRLEYRRKRKDFGVGANSSDDLCNTKGYYLAESNKPTIDTATHRYGGSTWTFDEARKVDVETFTVVEIPQEELIKAKIKEGEAFVNGLISEKLNIFNATHGTVFTKINDMGIYIYDDTYYLQAECIIITKWNNLLWATSRAKQNDVLTGVLSEDDFKALLVAI